MGEFREDLLPHYPEAPHLRPLPVREEGRVRYQLISNYSFRDQFGESWIIKRGYVYDGASIPTLLGATWIATYSKFHPAVMRSALAHDFLCDVRPGKFTSSQAADLFERMLLEDGASAVKAAMMANAVRWFGPRWGEA